METTVIERIKLIANENKLSYRKFAIKIEFNYATLNNYIIGKRNSIDIDLLVKTLTSFDDVSAEWLLLGKGSIHKISEEKRDISTDTNNLMMKTIIELSGKNALLEEKVRMLESEKSYLNVAEKETSYTKKK